jgi:hypothetical protein
VMSHRGNVCTRHGARSEHNVSDFKLEQHRSSLIREVLLLNSPFLSISKFQLKVRKELESELVNVFYKRAIHLVCGDFVSNKFSLDNNMKSEMLKYLL